MQARESVVDGTRCGYEVGVQDRGAFGGFVQSL